MNNTSPAGQPEEIRIGFNQAASIYVDPCVFRNAGRRSGGIRHLLRIPTDISEPCAKNPGLFVDIALTLCSVLPASEYTCIFRLFDHSDFGSRVDGQTNKEGSISSSWNGLVGDILRKDGLVDTAFMDATPSRATVLDFVDPVQSIELFAVTEFPSTTADIQNLMVFTPWSWLLVFGFTVAIGLLITAVHRRQNFQNGVIQSAGVMFKISFEDFLTGLAEATMALYEKTWMLNVAALSPAHSPISLSMVVLLFWRYACVFLDALYTSGILGHLMVHNYHFPYRSFDELLDCFQSHRCITIAPSKADSSYDGFRNSVQFPRLTNILNDKETGFQIGDYLKRPAADFRTFQSALTRRHQHQHLVQLTTGSRVAAILQQDNNIKAGERARSSKECIHDVQRIPNAFFSRSFAFRKSMNDSHQRSAKLIRLFNSVLPRLKERGLIERLTERYTPTKALIREHYHTCYRPKVSRPQSIPLDRFLGLLIPISIFLALAFLLLLFELSSTSILLSGDMQPKRNSWYGGMWKAKVMVPIGRSRREETRKDSTINQQGFAVDERRMRERLLTKLNKKASKLSSLSKLAELNRMAKSMVEDESKMNASIGKKWNFGLK